MAPILTRADVLHALVVDHVHDRHAVRAHADCPVCQHFMPAWRRRAMERIAIEGNGPVWITRGGAE